MLLARPLPVGEGLHTSKKRPLPILVKVFSLSLHFERKYWTMKKLKSNLSQLIEQNKQEILNDIRQINKIEEKIDEKYTSNQKENAR
jgi:Fur-regulated basic protein B